MKQLQMQELTPEKFTCYGSFADMLHPRADSIGSGPFVFFRDMLHQDLGRDSICYSVLQVQPRDFLITVSERHNFTAEMLMPLDQDVAIHVAPANCGEEVPLDKIEIFKVPKITMVILGTGVWHHTPFALGNAPANVLIGLPKRLYDNDLVALDIPGDQQPEIKL